MFNLILLPTTISMCTTNDLEEFCIKYMKQNHSKIKENPELIWCQLIHQILQITQLKVSVKANKPLIAYSHGILFNFIVAAYATIAFLFQLF